MTKKILVVGATGSIGRLVVRELIKNGYQVRVLTRHQKSEFDDEVEVFIGQLTDPKTLKGVTDGIDGIIFTHGSNSNEIENVDYRGTLNILNEIRPDQRPYLVFMSAVSVTAREMAYNKQCGICDWKRRAERLIRATSLPYTIVRPGWFDCNSESELKLIFRQGDRFGSGTPADGVVSRAQIAEVLVKALFNAKAQSTTFELVAVSGPATTDFDAYFNDIPKDILGSEDAPDDRHNQPLCDEPENIRKELFDISNKFLIDV